jgi:hypothetical protein
MTPMIPMPCAARRPAVFVSIPQIPLLNVIGHRGHRGHRVAPTPVGQSRDLAASGATPSRGTPYGAIGKTELTGPIRARLRRRHHGLRLYDHNSFAEHRRLATR